MSTEFLRSDATAGTTKKPALPENVTGEKEDLIDTAEHSSIQKRSVEATPEETPVETLAEASSQHEREYVHGMKLMVIMVPVTLVYFLLMLDTSIVSTAVPTITSEFDSLKDIGWYVLHEVSGNVLDLAGANLILLHTGTVARTSSLALHFSL